MRHKTLNFFHMLDCCNVYSILFVNIYLIFFVLWEQVQMELGEVAETERKPNFWMVGIYCVRLVRV